MFQILFGFGTDTAKAGWFNDALRTLFGMFDFVVYTLISFVYQILFAIADSGIISSEYMAEFYNRFQEILGVFMVFKLTISVLQYVVNPDLMNDKKQGISNIITRIVTMLAMLMAIMPLNIPDSSAPDGSYNDYLNKNGLLFGTMYSVQSRILNQGVIEKFILGDTQLTGTNSDIGTNSNATSGNNLDIEDSANKLAVGLLKVFIRPNLKDASKGEEDGNFYCCREDNDSDCTKVDDGLLSNGDNQWYDRYNDENVTPVELVDMLSITCGKADVADNRYALSYMPIIPTLCGGLILWVLVTFCIEVAKRAIRLAILRLIAPIPIISYVDPKSSEKGAFAAWTKELITAFLQLFLALSIIFFTISLVSGIMNAFTVEVWGGDGFKTLFDLPNPTEGGFSLVNSVALVFIVVAIFLFAREAPRFIMNALGIKGTGYGLGLGAALGGLGAMLEGAGFRGLLSGSANAMQDASDAYVQGKAAPPAFGSQADRVRQMLTGDKSAHGGAFGRWQRSVNDHANQNMARHYLGLDRNINGQAKDEMYRLKTVASQAEEKYKRFSMGNMTAAEIAEVRGSNGFYNGFTDTSAFAAYGEAYRNQYIANHGLNANSARDQALAAEAFNQYWGGMDQAHQRAEIDNIYANLADDDARYNAMSQALESDWGSKQSAAGKQEALFNDGSKLLEAFGSNETLQEKYSRRGEGTYRASHMYREHGPGYSAPARGHRGYSRSHQYRSSSNRGRRQTRFDGMPIVRDRVQDSRSNIDND